LPPTSDAAHEYLHSFPTRRSSDLLLLASVFVAFQPSYAAPQSQQNANTFSPGLQSQAEQDDAVAQYNLAQSYLRHDPTNDDYQRSEEHTSELQSRVDLVCRLLLET